MPRVKRPDEQIFFVCLLLDLVCISCEVGVAKLEDLDYHDQSNDVPDGTYHD